MDFAVIVAANQFNIPPPPGQIYMSMIVAGVYGGARLGSPGDFVYNFKLVGAKNKVYDSAVVSDSSDAKSLALLIDQPDVVAGGAVAGAIYYLVEADDSSFLAVVDGSDGPQFMQPL